MPQDQLDYPTVCTYVGQLFLETRHELERLQRELTGLRAQLTATQNERDAALKLVAAPRPSE